MSKLVGWINAPIGRGAFIAGHLLSTFLADALLPTKIIYSSALIVLMIEVTALFTFAGILMAKRLVDIGQTRMWGLLSMVPAFAYLALATGWRGISQPFAIIATVGCLFFAITNIALMLIPGKSVGQTKAENRGTA